MRVSEIASPAAPLLFGGISVDARSGASFSSGVVLCQDLKERLKGPSVSRRGKLLPLGFGGENISLLPRAKKVS